VSDEELFPNEEGFLQSYEDRWTYMSQLAGDHKQDGAVLNLSKRHLTSPEVLRWGVPTQTAARIQELHLSLHDTEDLLPEWLDALASMFFQLEHLYILEGGGYQREAGPTCSSPRSSEMLRMRRLYILYRLPGLKSIDGKAVTELERSLARPDTPNGQRVKRNEWLPKESLMDNLDEEEDDDDTDGSTNENNNPVVARSHRKHNQYRHKISKHGDLIEVSLHGTVKRVPVDPPLTTKDGLDVERRGKDLKPRRHRRVVAPSQEANNNDDDSQQRIKLEQKRRRRRHSRREVDEGEEERQQLLLEMESVVSPQHHWSAACGGLTFSYCGNDTKYRSSGLCGRPRIRLQFGRSKKEEDEDQLLSSPETTDVGERTSKR
jgi:hypothetical protein